MLYKFKSKASGDVIMLEMHARKLLEIIGKEPGPRGIVEPAQMEAAVAALEQAAREQEAAHQAAIEQARAEGKREPKFEEVSLRNRVRPFIELLRRSQRDNEPITWGV